MNSQNKVIEIRKQKREKQRDGKKQIKNVERGRERVREVYGNRKDEAIKERDEMVLFLFPFWEFLCLCEAMPDC